MIVEECGLFARVRLVGIEVCMPVSSLISGDRECPAGLCSFLPSDAHLLFFLCCFQCESRVEIKFSGGDRRSGFRPMSLPLKLPRAQKAPEAKEV